MFYGLRMYWVSMYVRICVYKYIHVFTISRSQANTHARPHARTIHVQRGLNYGLPMCACMYVCVYLCMHAPYTCKEGSTTACRCVRVCMYVCVYVCMCEGIVNQIKSLVSQYNMYMYIIYNIIYMYII